ncbi:hypothetical protein ACWEQ7_20320 [Streptomyces sp. NPDC004069]
MLTHHRVAIQATAEAPVIGAPETAATRLVALLPATWEVVDLRCSGDTAVLSLASSSGTTAEEAATVIDEALSHPALTGWVLHRDNH